MGPNKNSYHRYRESLLHEVELIIRTKERLISRRSLPWIEAYQIVVDSIERGIVFADDQAFLFKKASYTSDGTVIIHIKSMDVYINPCEEVGRIRNFDSIIESIVRHYGIDKRNN